MTGSDRREISGNVGKCREMSDPPVGGGGPFYRFIAYRQYISWNFGWLGKDTKIPSCIVQKIWKTFPTPDNIYVPLCKTFTFINYFHIKRKNTKN